MTAYARTGHLQRRAPGEPSALAPAAAPPPGRTPRVPRVRRLPYYSLMMAKNGLDIGSYGDRFEGSGRVRQVTDAAYSQGR
jgi:hypothetical protein